MTILNRDWHAANRMPPKATRDQRAAWHYEHSRESGCREPSAKERELIEEHRVLVEAHNT